MGTERLYQVAAANHGVVTRDAALAYGVTDSTRREAIRRAGWSEPFPSTTLLPGYPLSDRARMAAGVGYVGADCALTGWGAAALYGLVRKAPTALQIVVPHSRQVASQRRLTIRRSRRFHPPDVRAIDGLPVVCPSWLLSDLAGHARVDRLIAWALELIGRGLLQPDDLDKELARRGRFAGRGTLRAVAQAVAADGSESGFEYAARQRLIAEGLPPDTNQAQVVVAGSRRRIDIPYSQRQVGVECLGHAYHSRREDLDRDARRHNAFATDGEWTLLELTWTIYTAEWDEFVQRLAAVLASTAEHSGANCYVEP